MALATVIPDPMSALIARAVAEKERLTTETRDTAASVEAGAREPLAMSGFNVPPEISSMQQFVQSLSSGVASAVSGNPRFAQNTAARQAQSESQRADALKQLNELRATELLSQKRQLHETRIADLQNKYELLKEAGRSEDALKVLEQQIASHKALEEIQQTGMMNRTRMEQQGANARQSAEISSREKLSAAEIASNEKIRLGDEYHKTVADIEDTAGKIRTKGFEDASRFPKDKTKQNTIILKALKDEESYAKAQVQKPIKGEPDSGYQARLVRAYPGYTTDLGTLSKVESLYLKAFPNDIDAKTSFAEIRVKLTKPGAAKATKKRISLSDIKITRHTTAQELLDAFLLRH